MRLLQRQQDEREAAQRQQQQQQQEQERQRQQQQKQERQQKLPREQEGQQRQQRQQSHCVGTSISYAGDRGGGGDSVASPAPSSGESVGGSAASPPAHGWKIVNAGTGVGSNSRQSDGGGVCGGGDFESAAPEESSAGGCCVRSEVGTGERDHENTQRLPPRNGISSRGESPFRYTAAASPVTVTAAAAAVDAETVSPWAEVPPVGRGQPALQPRALA
ncbi:unnamed protein product, partial [Phaeothamnion confervicola]